MKDDLKKLTAAEAISKIASVSDVEELEELADSESRKTVLKAIESRFDELAEEEPLEDIEPLTLREVELPQEEEEEVEEEPEPEPVVKATKRVPYNKTDSRLGFGRVSIRPNETIDVNQIPEAMIAFWEEIGAVGYRDEPV